MVGKWRKSRRRLSSDMLFRLVVDRGVPKSLWDGEERCGLPGGRVTSCVFYDCLSESKDASGEFLKKGEMGDSSSTL